MAKETINNGEGGLSVRGKLNNMFTELYNNLFGGGVTEAWVNLITEGLMMHRVMRFQVRVVLVMVVRY